MRRKLFWLLCGIADQLTDVAFSRTGRCWRSVWVPLANAIDRVAWHVMDEAMRREPAKAAPQNAQSEGAEPLLAKLPLD